VDINSTLWGQMITFAVFVWFTMKYVWPMLTEALKERQKIIAEGLAAGERGHKELEISQKSAIKHIREAREEANHIIDLARKQAIMIIEEGKLEANLEKEKILTLAKTEIEQQIRAAQEQLQGQLVNLVTLTTEKLLHRAINDDDQKTLLEIERKGIYG
jgi:F-type H+-transporting ATPase subunit b